MSRLSGGMLGVEEYKGNNFKKKKYTIIRKAISEDLAAFIRNYFCMQKQVYDTCKASRYF